jgi:hypothetical protein
MFHVRADFLKSKWLVASFLFLSLTHCFGGVDKTGKVRSYVPGTVRTEKGFYNVGLLPESWQQDRLSPYRMIVFYNGGFKSSIETDAFCDDAFDDASLKVLTTHLHFDLVDRKIQKEKDLMLDNRGALRTVASGKVDGVPIVLDTVVLKKDNCLFDFVLVAQPDRYSGAVHDFETFFGGFRYQGDI